MKKGGPKRSVELMGIIVVLSLPVGFSLGWRWLGLVLESEISMSESDNLVIVVLLGSASSLGRCNVPIPATLEPTAALGRSTDHDKIVPTAIGVFRTSRNPALDMCCRGTARPDPPFGQYSTQHGAWHAHGPTDSVRNVVQVSLMFFQYIYARMSIV